MSSTVSTQTANKQRLWRDSDGILPNLAALTYATAGHLLGIYLLLQPSWLLLMAGILLSGHTLIIAAYLVHEAAHMTLFKAKKHNRMIGEILLWMSGASYASFDRVRHMHLRHHRDRADVSCFDYQAFLSTRPAWVRKLVIILEWAYIPAVELIMHGQVIIRPFIDKHLKAYRLRVILTGLSRITLFSLLFLASPLALLGYAIAYWIMLQALFLGDAFAHTYDAFFVSNQDDDIPEHQRDKEYDVKHTYSNLVSRQRPWLNLLNLNFGYHTAHHARASISWHKLPELHDELYGNTEHEQVLPYSELFRTIHRNRVKRVFVDDYGDVGQGTHRGDSFVGAHGVSFLSIV